MLKLTDEQFSIARSFLVTMNDKFRTETSENDRPSGCQDTDPAIDILQVLAGPSSLIPGSIDAASVKDDLLLLEQLRTLLMLNEALSENLTEAIAAASSKTYEDGITLYRIIEIAKESNVAGAETWYRYLSGMPGKQ